jgi:hypothetical protein
MPDPFEDVRWKIWRADQHFAELHKMALATVMREDVYEIRTEADRENRPVIVVGAVPPGLPQMSLLIGDTAHNLRSALDHLMWLFAQPTKKQEIKVQFPIFYSGPKFRENAGRAMPGVPPGVRALVERLQPYHRRKWPETALLGYVREIDNWDKHRALTTAVAYTEAGAMKATVTGSAAVVSQTAFRGRLKPGKVLARWEMANAQEGDKLLVNRDFSPFPVFDNRVHQKIRRIPVLQTLDAARRFIRNDVLPLFRPFV